MRAATWEVRSLRFSRWQAIRLGGHSRHPLGAKRLRWLSKPTCNFTEVWYHIKVPYQINQLLIDYDIMGGSNDYCGFAISTDDRRSLWSLKQKSYKPHWGNIENGQAEWVRGEPSVQGLKEFWLRVDMYSHDEKPTLALQALNITVEFQHNMNLQPRILPGENPLYLEAETVDDGSVLEAEWIFQVNGEQEKIKLGLKSAGVIEERIQRDEKCPSELFMTGLRLTCK